MVEITGEGRGVGHRPDGKPWRVGVQAPPPNEKTIAQVLPLADLALATSGDFHNVHVVDGQRVTHIIDPRTGRPLPYRGASVTVVAETAFAADGVATALFVMGPDAGYDWCVEHNVAALFQCPDAHGRRVRRHTPRFDELVPPAP
jgi:thiamine biosynthesis lipoprotein